MKRVIDVAFDRLDDFESVQSGRSSDELLAAVTFLQESVGIKDDERRLIGKRLEARRSAAGTTGPVLLGVILGLMAAELEAESR